MRSTEIDFPIDFVISWVDNRDPSWKKKRNSYLNNAEEVFSDASEERYRDFGFFEFLLKSIQKYAPWVHHVYIVTDGQVPSCIPADRRFTIVDHKQFIPEKYLPTFNSSVIELYLNNIPKLSEHFVYFNDDMLLNGPVNKGDFFNHDGFPKDSFLCSMLQPEYGNYFEINNARIVNENFPKINVIKSQFLKMFSPIYGLKNLFKTALTLPYTKWSTFKNLHIPYSLCKTEYSWLKKYAKTEFEITSENKFRGQTDINIWLIQDIRYCLGAFSPRSTTIGHYMNFDNQLEIIKDLKKKNPRLLVINDDSGVDSLNRKDVSQKITAELIKKFSP